MRRQPLLPRYPSDSKTRQRSREQSGLAGRRASHPERVLVDSHHVEEAHEHLVVRRSDAEGYGNLAVRGARGRIGNRGRILYWPEEINEASTLQSDPRSAGDHVRDVRVAVDAANPQLGGPQHQRVVEQGRAVGLADTLELPQQIRVLHRVPFLDVAEV